MDGSNFINSLSAKMAEQSVDSYVETRENWLTKLDKIKKIAEEIKVRTFEEYDKAMNLKKVIGSLFCYCFNNKKDLYNEVGNTEDIVGRKLFNFVKRKVSKNPDVKAVCRYLLSMRYYPSQNEEKIFNFLLEHDVLRREKDRDTILVVGLHGKVGDNVFTMDNRGRHHRQYVESCALQAIYISNSRFRKYAEEHIDLIPILDDRYTTVSARDGKHCIRPVRLRRREINFVYDEFC